jgi:regulator of replication initiation timing
MEQRVIKQLSHQLGELYAENVALRVRLSDVAQEREELETENKLLRAQVDLSPAKEGVHEPGHVLEGA